MICCGSLSIPTGRYWLTWCSLRSVHGPIRETSIARICRYVATCFIWSAGHLKHLETIHLLKPSLWVTSDVIRCPYRFKWHLQRCAHGITRPPEFAAFAAFAQPTLRFQTSRKKSSSRSRVYEVVPNADRSDPSAEKCRRRGYLGAYPCGLPAACAGHLVSWPCTPWLRHSAGGPGQNGRWMSLGEGGSTSRPWKVAQRGILQTYPVQSSATV